MKKLLGITVFLVFIYVALLVANPNAVTRYAHFSLGKEIGLFGVLSLAAGLLIVTGGIDLSIGSLVCLTSTVFALLVVDHGVDVVTAFLAMMTVGALVGLTYGLLVTKLRLQPFMVTLCGLFILRSLARWLAGETNIEGIEKALKNVIAVFRSQDLVVPVYLICLLILAAIAAVFLHQTVHGRYFHALGSNEKAARFAGVNVDLYKILAYVLCSMLTSVYSFLALMNSPSVAPSDIGQGLELTAIAGAVLGGCALRGGEGTVYGMVVGTAIIQVLLKLRAFLSIPDRLEGMMIGGILLLGVILDEILRRREAQARTS